MATIEKPVTINIYSENGRILVSNNNQKKKYLPRERKATGISNIMRRYAFFTEQKIEIVDTNEKFIVILPLLK